jgi:hypothetical protein
VALGRCDSCGWVVVHFCRYFDAGAGDGEIRKSGKRFLFSPGGGERDI